MANVRAWLKEGESIPSLPLRSANLVQFQDPRNGSMQRAYLIDTDRLTDEEWEGLRADMQKRWPETPWTWTVPDLKATIKTQGLLPLRAERVQFVEIEPEGAGGLSSV